MTSIINSTAITPLAVTLSPVLPMTVPKECAPATLNDAAASTSCTAAPDAAAHQPAAPELTSMPIVPRPVPGAPTPMHKDIGTAIVASSTSAPPAVGSDNKAEATSLQAQKVTTKDTAASKASEQLAHAVRPNSDNQSDCGSTESALTLYSCRSQAIQGSSDSKSDQAASTSPLSKVSHQRSQPSPDTHRSSSDKSDAAKLTDQSSPCVTLAEAQSIAQTSNDSSSSAADDSASQGTLRVRQEQADGWSEGVHTSPHASAS